MAQNRMTLSFRSAEEMALFKAVAYGGAIKSGSNLSEWIVSSVMDGYAHEAPAEVYNAVRRMRSMPLHEDAIPDRLAEAEALEAKYRDMYLCLKGRKA